MAARTRGTPTIVLLPGMDGTGELFVPLVQALGSQCRTVTVRYPNEQGLNYAQLEAVARAALPENESFVLLGESFSGPVAIALAASHPPRLQGLVLCCSFVRNPRRALALMRHGLGLIPFGAAPTAALDALLLGKFSTPSLSQSLRHAVAQVTPSVLRQRLRCVLTVDVSAALSAVTVPTLYLRALRDRLVPPAAAERVLALRPATRLVEIDAPHCLLQAAPQSAATALLEFVADMPT
jgi:pimeloyl-ACP methyl ester carboxylesterase